MMIQSGGTTVLNQVCEAIAVSIHYPSHLAAMWLVNYGHLAKKVNKGSSGVRHQLRHDYKDTYKEMQHLASVNDRQASSPC